MSTSFNTFALNTINAKLSDIKRKKGQHFTDLRWNLENVKERLLQDSDIDLLGLLAFPATIDVLTEAAEFIVQRYVIDLRNAQALAEKFEKAPRELKSWEKAPQQSVDEKQERLNEWLETIAQPLRAAYTGWKRYFIVQGGHIHRGRSCESCYPTTRYGWLADMSGCDETKMVAAYGETACTVCFPDAPTMEGWGKNDESFCETSGTYYGPRSQRMSHYAKCTACGAATAITKSGNYRKHKKSV